MTALRFLLPLLLFSACTGQSDPISNGVALPAVAAETLTAAHTKIAANPAYRYHYAYRWDNGYADSLTIHYTRRTDSELGFAFLAEGTDKDVFYDGRDLLTLDHHRRTAVRTTSQQIADRDDYFRGKLYFQAMPHDLPTPKEINRAELVTDNGHQRWAYDVVTTQLLGTPERPDTAFTTRTYYIDPEANVLTRVHRTDRQRGVITRQTDVYFRDYAFQPEPHQFTAADRPVTSRYTELSPAEVARKKQSRLITVGERLTRSDYMDITGEERLLYGQPGERSVIMFGFIGCGLCNAALRKMQADDYRVRPGLTLHYSSPVDGAAALNRYFAQKGLPYPGYGKDSHMNDNFGVAAFPTFVFVDAEGVVEGVFGGYDEEVAGMIGGR